MRRDFLSFLVFSSSIETLLNYIRYYTKKTHAKIDRWFLSVSFKVLPISYLLKNYNKKATYKLM